ncbi:MAG TPA: zinc metalloprotease [Streptosporangiaceae bacterium]|nr:zinc metalloprotease [Streptosporangiaceae bacterium]
MKRPAPLALLGVLTVLTAFAPPRPVLPARAAAPCPGDSAARVRAGVQASRDPDALDPAEAAAAGARLDRVPAARRVAAAEPVRVPVYFHVIHDGPAGDITTATIRRQLAVLNATFGGRTGGADTGFRFTVRGVDRTDNASWYRRPDGHERAIKARLHRGDAGTLNLYTADLGEQLLGWASFPWRHRDQAALDGVFVHVDGLVGGSIEHYNRGYSATHEIGHWLGLFHTFQDGCAAPGDRVADTPPEREPGQGCPAAGRDTCPAPGEDPIHNFMDYSWDTCMTGFTRGQSERMHVAWITYRA